jgi:hypothetical protein
MPIWGRIETKGYSKYMIAKLLGISQPVVHGVRGVGNALSLVPCACYHFKK